MLLHNRTVIVTGASQGIGRSTSALLATAGARVIAVARTKEPLLELADQHPRIEAFEADLTVEEDRAAVVAAAGHVDVLVNNAGRSFTGLVEEMTADDVREIFELNVLSLIDLTQKVMPGMLDRRQGHIVNVGSITGYASTPPLTAYSSSKFAIQGFSDGLRREVATRGVHVSLVTPGPVDTGLLGDASKAGLGSSLPAEVLGVPSWMVAAAVLRAVLFAPLPGYATIAVPRIAGISRLAEVPGFARLLDLAVGPLAQRLRTRS